MTRNRDPRPILVSWSTGKDSALALARLLDDPRVVVTGLLTTVTSGHDRVSIHGVRRSLLHQQAGQLGLELCEIEVRPNSPNDAYEAAWREALGALPFPAANARHIAFGDIFLEDIRRYRTGLVRSCGYEPLFPIWGESTGGLAAEMLDVGITARVVCVDTQLLDANYVGRAYDAAFIDSLPSSADPCGENGEFHTFVSRAPGFRNAVPYRLGDVVLRDGRFAYRDLLPHVGPR